MCALFPETTSDMCSTILPCVAVRLVTAESKGRALFNLKRIRGYRITGLREVQSGLAWITSSYLGHLWSYLGHKG